MFDASATKCKALIITPRPHTSGDFSLLVNTLSSVILILIAIVLIEKINYFIKYLPKRITLIKSIVFFIAIYITTDLLRFITQIRYIYDRHVTLLAHKISFIVTTALWSLLISPRAVTTVTMELPSQLHPFYSTALIRQT